MGRVLRRRFWRVRQLMLVAQLVALMPPTFALRCRMSWRHWLQRSVQRVLRRLVHCLTSMVMATFVLMSAFVLMLALMSTLILHWMPLSMSLVPHWQPPRHHQTSHHAPSHPHSAPSQPHSAPSLARSHCPMPPTSPTDAHRALHPPSPLPRAMAPPHRPARAAAHSTRR